MSLYYAGLNSWGSSTDSDGYYTIRNLPSGNYQVYAGSSSGYVTEYFRESVSRESATPVVVQIETVTDHVDFTLAQGGSIRGRITSRADGTGLGGANVYLQKSGELMTSSGLADESGYYEFNGLDTGAYFLWAGQSGYETQYFDDVTSLTDAAPISVTRGVIVDGINFGLRTLAVISGRVTSDADGSAIQDALVSVYSSNRTLLRTAQTDPSGYYNISGLTSGSYFIGVTSNNSGYIDEYYNEAFSLYSADSLAIQAGNEHIVNFGLALGRSVSGRVTRDSDGSPLRNVYVYAYSQDSQCSGETRTDDSGNYTIRGLVPGNYIVRSDSSTVYIGEYYKDAVSSETATIVAVPPQSDVGNIDFSLATGGSISGSISGYYSYYDSVSIGYIRVYDPTGRLVWPPNNTIVATPWYYIAGLLPGIYYVEAQPRYSLISEFYDDASDMASASPVLVTQGENTGNINFHFDLGQLIKGRITDDAGNPIEGVTVCAFQSDPAQAGARSAVSNSQGDYEIGNLAPGSYRVKTINGMGYLDEYYDDADEQGAKVIELVAWQDVEDINFRLSRTGSISGKIVKDSDGTGIPGVKVEAKDLAGQTIQFVTSDMAGNYLVTGLSTGDYYIAAGGAGFLTRFYPDALNQSSAEAVRVAERSAVAGIDISLPSDSPELTLASGGANSEYRLADSGLLDSGYAILNVTSGTTPYGTAVFKYRQNGVTVSEAGVPASPPTRHARIFIDYRSRIQSIPSRSNSGIIDVNTGIVLVNTGSEAAEIEYTLLDMNGNPVFTGQGMLAAGRHIARFIDQFGELAPGFNMAPDFQFGILDIASDRPLSILALRMTTNQRNEALFTTTPVADLERPGEEKPLFFPQVADGGGYTTSLILMNTSSAVQTGRLQFFDNEGLPFEVHQVGGGTGSSFEYSIPPEGAFHFQTDGNGTGSDWRVGWARLQPDDPTSVPVASGIFAFNPADVLVTESGVPSSLSTTHARIYVDLSAGHNTGLALANTSDGTARITIRALQSDGVTPAGEGENIIELAAHGHVAKFANEFVSGLQPGFKGVLDVSSEDPFTAVVLRTLDNERGEFLMTTFPVADAARPAPSPVVFPHIVCGGGYETEFILLSSEEGAEVRFERRNGDGEAVDSE